MRPADESDDCFDLYNLTHMETGIDGVLRISTRQAVEGPHIIWFPGRPIEDGPRLMVTLEMSPRVVNHGLPQDVMAASAPLALAWAEANRAALLHFWEEGLSWSLREVRRFVDGLAKLA